MPKPARPRLLRCEPLEARHLLSIDLGLDWATYLGGSESDTATAIAVDAAGNSFVTGVTHSPDIVGANNAFYGGSYDAYVAKVSGDGTLAWLTYLGGSGDDTGENIAIDAEGNILVAGASSSLDLAEANNAHHGASFDAYVTKLNGDGTVAWATYLGGSGDDRWAAGRVSPSTLAAMLSCQGRPNHPTSTGANNAFHGASDAFVAKVTSDGSLAWATYVGGTARDYGQDIAIDAAGNAVVTGYTGSADLAGANNASHGGQRSLRRQGDGRWFAGLGNLRRRKQLGLCRRNCAWTLPATPW